MNIRLKNGAYLGLIILLVFFGLGCASTHKTTKTETTVTYSDEAAANEGELSGQSSSGAVEKSETTTTTTTDTKADQPGILSSTIHAVGYVLALPFIIVAGLFRMIF